MNNEVLDMLVDEYVKPTYLEWEKNGMSEEYIKGYRIAIANICVRLFGEDSINILEKKLMDYDNE